MQGDDPGPEYGGLDDAPAQFRREERNGVVPFTPPRGPPVRRGLTGLGGEPCDATIRVLLIEADPDDSGIVEQLLEKAENARFMLHRSADHEEGLHRLLGGEHDVALVGHGSDAGESLRFVVSAARRGARQPVILLSGCGTAGLDLAAIDAGAAEFLDKEQLEVEQLERTIRLALAREQRRAQLAPAPALDPLTGLAGAAAHQDRLERALAGARRRRGLTALLLIDLDAFDPINRRFGLAGGDSLLRLVGARLQRHLRATDSTARLRADRFGVVLEELARPEHAGAVALKLLAAIARPLTLGGETLGVTASAGVALFPDDAEDAASLAALAEVALREAKLQGGNGCRRRPIRAGAAPDPDRTRAVALERAIRSGELVLLFQPQVTLCSPELGLASMVSWPAAPAGCGDGSSLVALAEASALTDRLSEWMLAAACRQIASWQQAGLPRLHMAVPLLSRRQLRWTDLAGRLERRLAAAGAPAHWLELEIDEALLLEELAARGHALASVRALGVRVAVGSYGSGATSLSILHALRPSTLKLARAMLQGVPSDRQRTAVLSSVVRLARELGLRVVAEGVENQVELQLLRQLGCDAVQAVSSCPPLPADACADWLRQAASRA
jgi:diguanylate cyclase (GGDEF)-like protein